jgi:hypothetical protein
MNRKQRRSFAKAQQKAGAEAKLIKQVTQFDKLPDMCLTCEREYDKKSKEMAKTWNVVVKDENTVRLYCPECWDMANELIKKVVNDGRKNRD